VHGAQFVEGTALELGCVARLEETLDAFRGNPSLEGSELPDVPEDAALRLSRR